MAVTFPRASHEGLRYFLLRAAEMSLEDARNVLKLETRRNNSYNCVWHSAEKAYCDKVERFPNHSWNRMPRECYIAVICFTLDRSWISRHLTGWCRGAQPTASVWCLFPYKSLWCFLVRAFEMLPEVQVNHVFRAVEIMHVSLHEKVLVTEFLSGSVSFETVFNYSFTNRIFQAFSFVPAQLVRDISVYSTREDYQEVLIWPLCTFQVFRIGRNTFAFNFCSDFPPCHTPGLLPAWS